MYTVKELIEELKKYDENLPVKIKSPEAAIAETVTFILQCNWPKGTMWGTCLVLGNDYDVDRI